MGAKELSREELLEYLETAIELEKQTFIQANAIDAIDEHCNSLGSKKAFKRPEAPCFEEDNSSSNIPMIIVAVVLIVVGFLEGKSCGGFLAGAGIIIGIIMILSTVLEKGSNNDTNKYLMLEYNRKKETYERNVKEDEARVRGELIEKRNYLNARDDLNKLYEETESTKQKYYEVGVLDDVYWGDLSALCSFYQYLKAERCYSLKGHEGAYNMYETEKRLDKIVDNLEIVIEKLEQIEYNQRQLYVAITDGIDRTNNLLSGISEGIDKMGSTLNSIKEQGAVAAEYQRQAAASAKSMEWMASTNWLDRRM